MRYAALAFGVLAGLVASLILALGGLDPAVLKGIDPRPLSFALFVIASLSIFGAGIVLALPLVGAVLMLVGAVAWVVVAIILHHGPDAVMITPPALLLVGAIIATASFIRRRRSMQVEDELEPLSMHMDARRALAPQSEEEDEEEQPQQRATPVGATFFGHGGTAMPLHAAHDQPRSEPALRGLDENEQINNDDWRPGKRRAPPPRQKPMFRDANEADDEDEPSGLSRIALGVSGLLSFGLYAALATAAVLLFWNLRTGDLVERAGTKVRPSASSELVAETKPSSTAPKAPVLAPALPKPSSSVLPLPSSSAPPPSIALAPSSEPLNLTNGVQQNPNLGGLVTSPVTDVSSAVALPPEPASSAPAPDSSSSVPPPSSSPPPPDAADASSSSLEPVVADNGTTPVMPWTMSTQMAAERAQKSPRRPAPQQAPPANNTGL